jgi:ketosteroid isomerase-like protein
VPADAAPPATAPAAAPLPPAATDEREISRVIDAYAAALSTRDDAEVAKVRDMSAATRGGLEKAFEAVRSQRVAIAGAPRITVDGTRARVQATLRYDVERSTGERAQRDVTATLVLNRIRNEWRIVRVGQ